MIHDANIPRAGVRQEHPGSGPGDRNPSRREDGRFLFLYHVTSDVF